MSNIPELASYREEEDDEENSSKKYRRAADKLSDIGSANFQNGSVHNDSRSQISMQVVNKPSSDMAENHQR